MEKTAAKFVSREYTVPVQAVNEMAERLGQSMINRYNEQTSKYLLEFSREKSKLLNTLKAISEKSIEFDIENYRKERKRLLKPPPPPDILIPKKVLQAVPANCVLDFGPGNSIMYVSGNNKKGVISRNSVITNPHKRKNIRLRPFTAIPAGTKRPKSVAAGLSGRNTSLGFVGSSGRNSALELTATSGRNTPFRQQSSRIRTTELYIDNSNDYNSNCEPVIEYNHKNSHKWEMPNRSFRQLKQLYTYTEEEKPDVTAERFRMMKMRENAYFHHLEEKVKEFHV